MHRVKIHRQGAAGQWPERGTTAQQMRSRSQWGLLGNRTSLMRRFIFHIKGLCASLGYSNLLKCIIRYPTKQPFWLSCYSGIFFTRTMGLFPGCVFKRFSMKMSWRQAPVDEPISRIWLYQGSGMEILAILLDIFMGKANFLSFLCSRWWNTHGTATGNMAGATTSSNPSPRKDIPPISSVSKERTCMLESHLHVNDCSWGMIRYGVVKTDTGNPIYTHFYVPSTARTLERWDVLAQFAILNHFCVCLCVCCLSLALSCRAKEDLTTGTESDLCVYMRACLNKEISIDPVRWCN